MCQIRDKTPHEPSGFRGVFALRHLECPQQVNNQSKNPNQKGFTDNMYIQYRLRINKKTTVIV